MRAYLLIVVAGMLVLSANATAAQSQSPTEEAGRTKKGAFSCLPVAEFQKISGDDGDVAINNFSVREAKSVIAPGLTTVEVSFAVANRSGDPYRLDSNFIFTDADEKPLAAASVEPFARPIAPGSTGTLTASTYIAPGTLAQVKQICLRLYGTKQ